jgi:purine nucleosidase
LNVWIDTDVGTNPDDAIALAVACAHPEAHLVGVSTVDDDDGRRAAIARDVVESFGGDPRSVVSGRAFNPRMLATARPDALVAIGPLTNIARVVDGGLRPSRIVVMGGALTPVWHRGEWREIESNFGADPTAAARVLASIDVLLLPLDVTARVCLDDAERTVIAAENDTLSHELASWELPVCLHDPLALLASLGEPYFSVEPRRIAVEPTGRVVENPDGRVHQVVTGVDRDAAVARIFQLLSDNQ